MPKLNDLKKHELIRLVNALKSQNEENGSFVEAFLASGKSEPVLKRYVKMIDKALDIMKGNKRFMSFLLKI